MVDNPEFRKILDQEQKLSPVKLYENKWKSLIKYTQPKGMTPVPASLEIVLTFILHLFNLELSQSTLKVYVSAIVAQQPPGSQSAKLLSHPTLKRFMKGLQNIRP